MSNENLLRMIRLAEEFFNTKNDPSQISVTPDVIARLGSIHRATLSEKKTSKGPVAWILIIPTTVDLMDDFLAEWISEQDLLERTPVGKSYDALYLCSALVLPEFRGKGLARELTVKAVDSVKKDHPITSLFYWSYSEEGDGLAKSVAEATGLNLRKRKGE